MKQCTGDSSERRKCLNLSSSFHMYTAARGRLFIICQRGAYNSIHNVEEDFNGSSNKRAQLGEGEVESQSWIFK